MRRRSTSPSLSVVCVAVVWIVVALTALLPTVSALDSKRPISQFGRDVWQDGLPQNTVHTVVQTRDGYLWIGTYEGLVRFNGVDFTIFDKSNTPELKAKGVRSLCQDRAGNLWIGTLSGGLTRYADGGFTTYSKADGLPNEFIYAVHEDRSGVLWIGTDGGLAAMRDGSFSTITTREGLSSNNVRAICEDSEGNLWIGTDGGGLNRYRDGRIDVFGKAEGIPHPTINALTTDAAGALWIGTNGGGLCRYQGGSFTQFTKSQGLSNDRVFSLMVDRQQMLWIGTDGGGLNRLRDGAFEKYTTAEGLSQDFVRSMCEDHEGSLWVGTNGGLNRLRDGKLVSYTTTQGLSQNNIRVVVEDARGVVWIGTDGGGVNGIKPDGSVEVLTTKNGLSNDFIRSFCVDSDGGLWIGTNGGGVNKYKDGAFTRFTTKEGVGSDEVRALCQDRAGTVWMGTVGGGVTLYRDGELSTITKADGLPHNDVRAIFEEKEGVMWLGTYGGGVARYENGTFQTWSTAQGLANATVLAIYKDGGGAMWFGTNSGGLSRFKDGAFTTYTTLQGLFDDTIFQILEDRSGNLWFGCNKGIFRVSLAELTAVAEGAATTVTSTPYGKADGMGSNQCNGASQPAGWKTQDGRLWFPTVAGVAVINPEAISINRIPPPVTIPRVIVDGQSLKQQPDLQLPASPEKFEFHYDGLSFAVPERVRFKYQLEGLDREWVDAGTRRVAYYTNLQPGEYRFRVIACNNDGIWNEQGATFAFTIPTPLWRTSWAYLLYLAGFVGLAYGASQWRFRAFSRQNLMLEAKIKERTTELAEKVELLEVSEKRAIDSEHKAHESERRALELAEKAQEANRAKSVFLANMSHELRTPLNAILGFVQVMSRRAGRDAQDRQHLGIILRSGEHLLGLINDVLSISKIEAGRVTLNNRPFELQKSLKGIGEMFRVRCENKNLTFRCEFATSIPRFVVGDEGKLRQILINLLGNAVKFTDTGYVELRARWHDGVASFEVEDTGPGLDRNEIDAIFEAFTQSTTTQKAQEGTGLGLTISREYINLMGGTITVDSEKGAGSTFGFTVNLGEADERPLTTETQGEIVGIAGGQPSRTLLIVDDTPENRAVLIELLRPFGFKLFEAANGAEAVDLWHEFNPDLIWMDMRMPVMDGFEAVKRIREAGGRCAIVGLTASAFEHDREAILAAGCDDFVAKPFRDSEIFDRLSRFLDVEFLYEEPPAENGDMPSRVADITELAARIPNLPDELVSRLQDAMITGSARKAADAIAKIRDHDAVLAGEIAQKVHEFAFDDVLAVIERGKRESGNS